MTTPPIDIYTTSYCPFCTAAKALLREKGLSFREIDVEGDPVLREAMIARAGGRRTVPQIFFGDRHVGGCDDLRSLSDAGGLDSPAAMRGEFGNPVP